MFTESGGRADGRVAEDPRGAAPERGGRAGRAAGAGGGRAAARRARAPARACARAALSGKRYVRTSALPLVTTLHFHLHLTFIISYSLFLVMVTYFVCQSSILITSYYFDDRY